MSRFITAAVLATSLAGAIVPSAAMAHDRYDDSGYGYSNDAGRGDTYGWRDGYRNDGYRNDGYRNDGYADNRYGRDGYRDGYRGDNSPDRRAHRDDRYRCRGNGTAGALIGAIAGGLLGNGLSGRGDHTFGTVLGAGAGALAGNAIGRSDNRCR